MRSNLIYKVAAPAPRLKDFVDSFWMLRNPSDASHEVVVLPDGRIDLFLATSAAEPFHITLLSLDTQPTKATIDPRRLTYAISFKPLAMEYLFHRNGIRLSDHPKNLADDLFGFSAKDMNDFSRFCKKATSIITSLLPDEIDDRKRRLFDLIFSSNGELSVKALSEQVFWSSRQINRYFHQTLGVSLKTYCSILRFRASFHHIKEGKLFPEQRFFDQSHFIREIKKLSGVSPKELSRNQNDRFIQFSTLGPA
ncbi:helix-turn-helix domain-containing protein [Chitinophaga lutea]